MRYREFRRHRAEIQGFPDDIEAAGGVRMGREHIGPCGHVCKGIEQLMDAFGGVGGVRIELLNQACAKGVGSFFLAPGVVSRGDSRGH